MIAWVTRELAGIGAKVHIVLNLEGGTQISITRTFDDHENPISVNKYPSREPFRNH